MLMSKCHYSLATDHVPDAYLSGSIDCDSLMWTDEPLFITAKKKVRLSLYITQSNIVED